MQDLDILKKFIREHLRRLKLQTKEARRLELQEQYAMRRDIRRLIREKQDTTQHNSTGLNALEKLLGSIVPILEVGYKDLKTAEEQRKSFKAHILSAIQNLLSMASIYVDAENKTKSDGQQTTVSGDMNEAEGGTEDSGGNVDPVANNPAFINVDKEKSKPEKPDPVNAFKPIETEDLTGRNFALETFKKIQKQILEVYSLLSNPEDREIFYDYLLTNVKLYFDKFETELQATPNEPTTQEYEAQKQKMNAGMSSAVPPTEQPDKTGEL